MQKCLFRLSSSIEIFHLELFLRSCQLVTWWSLLRLPRLTLMLFNVNLVAWFDLCV